jgi:hypothetical protein
MGGEGWGLAKGKGVGCWGSEKRGVGFEAETEGGF